MQTLFYQKCSEVPPQEGRVLRKMAYTQRIRPKGVPFLGLQVYDRVWILLLEVYERVGKFVIAVCEWIKKG